jgi:hypothetical protein
MNESLLTLIIPSRNELFLRQTILDVLAKARGDIRVYAVLDGYDPPAAEIVSDERLTYVRLPSVSYLQKRQAINLVESQTSGTYIMALDAHCMVAEGFDVALTTDYEPHSVVIPRRHRLDAENWCLQEQADARPPIDYEYIMWPLKFDPFGLHGFRWDARTREREHILVDETMEFQGSCWFMARAHFRRLGLMQVDGYTGWGQEAEEIGLKTWRMGGRVLTNKKTWYAHLHKGPKYGRMYHMSRDAVRLCNTYSFDYWVRENREFFQRYIEKFWPVPGWPQDWQAQLYNEVA